MKERIRELAEEAGLADEVKDGSRNVKLEKFAALIILECAGIVRAEKQKSDVRKNGCQFAKDVDMPIPKRNM